MDHSGDLAMMRLLILGVVGVLVISGCASSRPPADVPGSATVPPSTKGPGLRRTDLTALVLLVPRTFELTHVTPAAFAQALGKDVTRIFEFVRDTIAYETYAGVLRGPRGTLLALAGNSADRASLLASLLTEAGFRVRYARGTLPDPDARELVESMWAGPVPQAPAGDAGGEAGRAFAAAAKRNFERLRDALTGIRLSETPAGSSLEALLAQARSHYWVQVEKDGRWVDLDPLFADAAVGKTYAAATETLNDFPDALYHRVTVRLLAETSDGAQVQTTDLLTYSARAADLSATGALLVHVPENWQGPVRNIQSALGAALAETGRIKPVLLVPGRAPVLGAAVRTAVKTTGVGGIGNLLSGEGTRDAVALATAEWIEFTFVGPDGRTETVVRELFDLVGKARRAKGQPLTQEELRTLAGGERTAFLRGASFNLFFTTGRLDAAHVDGIQGGASPGAAEERGTNSALRRLAITFYLISDALFKRMRTRDGTAVSFYPDSPRVFIAQVSVEGQEGRLTIDLRRDHVRAVAAGPNRQAPVLAGVLRGAVNGTLEQSLIDQVRAGAPSSISLRVSVSTSLLFAEADARNVPARLITSEQAPLDPSVPDDAAARLREEVRQGRYALALERPIEIAGVPRYGWWRIHPLTGETIAVTDEGLHSGEYVLVVEAEEGKWDAILVTGAAVTPVLVGVSEAAMLIYIRLASAGGFTVVIPGF
jgi:transglutaminase-like putative cysteine protease